MTTFFLGGSRSISQLNAVTRDLLDEVIKGGHHVIVGDANGADKAFQDYLSKKGYVDVTVFCAGGVCRNNLGGWKLAAVSTLGTKGGFEHYAAKDRRMADLGDSGLFLWNGKSRGTLNSIQMLLRRGRPVQVYFSHKRSVVTINREQELELALEEKAAGPRPAGRSRGKGRAIPEAQRSLFS